MPPRAKKEVAAPPPRDESLPLLQFGADLFKQYASTTPPPSVKDLQLARFGDYAHHFGFSLERERALAAGTSTLPNLQTRGRASALVGTKHAQSSMLAGNDAVEEAGWEMPAEEKSAADARCVAVGALRDAGVEPVALALAICEPFQAVTWRQSRLQCALKKTRCVYSWLCQQVRVVLESEIESAAAARAKALAAEDKKKPRGKGSRAQSPIRKQGGSSAKKASIVAQQANNAQMESETPPPDPLHEALRTRVATPRVLAELYASMLHGVGVACDVVSGQLKGSAGEEAHDWHWNIVQIDGKSYLVDVACSSFTGVLRVPKVSGAGGDENSGATGVAGAGDGSTSATNTGARSEAAASTAAKKKRAAADSAAASAAAAAPVSTSSEDDATKAALNVAQEVGLSRQVRFISQHRPVEDFYFFCHPMHFIFTHFPQSDRQTLLVQPPHRAVWTTAPRLTHEFFRFPVALHSHRRSASFTTRSTPFYVSLTNTAPATTELACKVYRGHLADLPEHLTECDGVLATPMAAAAPGAGATGSSKRRDNAEMSAGDGAVPGSALSQDWIWQQRCESLQTETFTIMTPDVGYYCVVIGARSIRGDPYGASIACTAFTPLVRYQVKVNFVPVSTPLLPRQHLSPSVCRLMAPLSAQVQNGPCTVSVMPSCGNVAAVAVIARTTRQPPPPAVVTAATASKNSALAAPASTAQASQAATVAADVVQRDLLAFLPFNTSAAVYSGGVSLSPGMGMEVWILYSAPDEDGLTFRDRVQHRVAAASAAAATSSAPETAQGGGAGATTVSHEDRAESAASKARASKTKTRKHGGAGAAPDEEDVSVRQRAALASLLEQGRAFRPFVTGIEARKLITSDVKDLIQPQPTLEEECEPTLRRLIGVTDALYQEASMMRRQETHPVGTYLDARAPGTVKGQAKRL